MELLRVQFGLVFIGFLPIDRTEPFQLQEIVSPLK